MTNPITCEQQGNTALIVLDDGKANAFGFDFIDIFNSELDRAEKDSKTVAIIGLPGLLSGGFDLTVIQGGDQDVLIRLVNSGARIIIAPTCCGIRCFRFVGLKPCRVRLIAQNLLIGVHNDWIN